jgi:uncharacterized membrane protein YgcG
MMSLSEIMFMAIVVYLLYRFIVNFLVPVMRTTRQVREQFRNMQDQANGGNGASRGDASHGGFRPGGGFQPGAGFRANSGQDSGASARASEKRASAKPPADDYIEFEEIK